MGNQIPAPEIGAEDQGNRWKIAKSKHSERLAARCEALELVCVSSTSCACRERRPLIGQLASVPPGSACEECIGPGTCIEKCSRSVPNAPE